MSIVNEGVVLTDFNTCKRFIMPEGAVVLDIKEGAERTYERDYPWTDIKYREDGKKKICARRVIESLRYISKYLSEKEELV